MKAAMLSMLVVVAFIGSLAVLMEGSITDHAGFQREQPVGAVVTDFDAPPPPETLANLGGVYRTESFEEGLQRAFERAPAGVDRDDLKIIENLYQNEVWKDSVDGVTFGADGKVTEVRFRSSVPGAEALMEYAAGVLGPEVDFLNTG